MASVRRRQLMAELTALRERAGLSHDAAAHRLGWPAAKLTRIEAELSEVVVHVGCGSGYGLLSLLLGGTLFDFRHFLFRVELLRLRRVLRR